MSDDKVISMAAGTAEKASAFAFSLPGINGLYVMYTILLLMVIFIYRTLSSRQRSEVSLINFDDLLLEDDPTKPGMKRMSKTAPVFFGAFILTTWMMIYMTVKGTMTEGYFGAFGVMWVSPIVAKIIWGKPISMQPATGDNAVGQSGAQQDNGATVNQQGVVQ